MWWSNLRRDGWCKGIGVSSGAESSSSVRGSWHAHGDAPDHADPVHLAGRIANELDRLTAVRSIHDHGAVRAKKGNRHLGTSATVVRYLLHQQLPALGSNHHFIARSSVGTEVWRGIRLPAKRLERR